MDPVPVQKRMLRRKAQNACGAIDPEVAHLQDIAVLRKVLSLPEYVAAHTLFIYVSLAGEVDTHGIIRHALENGKRVAVPRCIAPGVMEMRVITGLNLLHTAAYGLLEPGEDCPKLAAQDIDFAVVPCAACDTSCNRLGKGGGYYDRSLRGRAFPAAVLCREAAIVTSVPLEQWDEPVDIVITEQRTIRRSMH